MSKVINNYTLQRYAVITLHASLMLMIWVDIYLVIVWHWWIILHAGPFIWMIYRHLRYNSCPLTDLEKSIMRKHGHKPYKGGFYEHYLFLNILKLTVSDEFAKIFLIFTKVIPGIVPFVYILWVLTQS